MKKFRSGFSMIELVLVMTVMGIVASVSSSIIVKVYEGYILQRAMYRANISTELVTTQIVNRLTYAVPNSLIARKIDTNPSNRDIDDIHTIQNLNLDDNDEKEKFGILEWIGYDNDSFSATKIPGWSGFCDINKSEELSSISIRIFTPGSDTDLNSASNIINYLGAVGGMGSTINDGALLFSGREYSNFRNYDPSCMGFINSECISKILDMVSTAPSTPEIRIEKNIDPNQKKIITDQYKLVWSAYAIVPENRDDDKGTYDLYLYSNYQPWRGENYLSHGDKNLLAKNVTQFKFYGKGSIIRFKVCIREETGLKVDDPENNLGMCKEKVVIK